MPEILEATCGVLRNISDLDDKEPIEIPPDLLQVLDAAAKEARKELECKCSASSNDFSIADPCF